jgi:hypothetical protein
LVQPGFPPNDWAPYCVDDVNPFPLQYVMDGAFDNLYRWVQEGIPAPTAARIQVSSAGATSTDVYGNALGGVRTPYLDVPTQTYYPTTPGTGSCELLWGHAVPFAGYFLRGLYATHHDYLSKVQQDAQSLMASKWLVPSDASQIELEADRSHIP